MQTSPSIWTGGISCSLLFVIRRCLCMIEKPKMGGHLFICCQSRDPLWKCDHRNSEHISHDIVTRHYMHSYRLNTQVIHNMYKRIGIINRVRGAARVTQKPRDALPRLSAGLVDSGVSQTRDSVRFPIPLASRISTNN